MIKRTTEKKGAEEPSRAQTVTFGRWPVLCYAFALLWCAWWYCRDASQGLFLLTAGVAAVAVALPQPVPRTTRWVIWLSLLMSVVCLAANVTRLVPPAGTLGDARVPDRAVTLLFALGVASLFFRPRTNGVTLVALAGLPMVMRVLGREGDEPGTVDGGAALLLIWLFFVWVILADLVQRMTAPHGMEQAPPGRREVIRRLAALGVVLALAYVSRTPVEKATLFVQKKVFGLVTDTGEGGGRRRGGALSLKRQPSANFFGRMRVLMLIQSDRFPGYLRESVYTTYVGGKWLAPKPGLELPQSGSAGTGGRQADYRLVPSGSEATATAWMVEVMAPQILGGFCLPGNAVSLRCEGPSPLADADGAVTASEALPDRFEARVVPKRVSDCAYPLPDGPGDPAYLGVPPELAAAASNWVASCEGLAEEPQAVLAARRVEAFFETNFTYRLGVTLRSSPDPLVDFMKRRVGSCTCFASAAALMFRSRGLPARVVGGYVCCGWNPWLDRWVVREREGHAWVEVWDASSESWLLVDPTPACGNPAALAKPGRIRFAVDLMVAAWKRLVSGMRNANLLEVIASAGETLFAFFWHTVWSVAGVVVLAGFLAVWWVRRRMRGKLSVQTERLRAELTSAMCRLARRTVPARLSRRVCEGWDAWLVRIGPDLPPETFTALRERTESYQSLRYAVRLDEAAARLWLDRARHAKRKDPRA